MTNKSYELNINLSKNIIYHILYYINLYYIKGNFKNEI